MEKDCAYATIETNIGCVLPNENQLTLLMQNQGPSLQKLFLIFVEGVPIDNWHWSDERH